MSLFHKGFSIPSDAGWKFSTGGGVLGPIKTKEKGRFSFARVAKSPWTISVNSPFVVPSAAPMPGIGKKEPERLDPRNARTGEREGILSGDVENFVVAVSSRCHFKIELSDPDEGDAYEVQDERGAVTAISIIGGFETWGATRGNLTKGTTPMVAVDESARTLVLLRAARELRRLRLNLEPGKPRVLRL